LHIQVRHSTIIMIKKLSVILMLTLFITGCGKNNQEPAYPVVYKKIQTATLKQLKTSFAQKNPFLITSLNEFGFCGSIDGQISGTSYGSDALTRAEAIALVKKFVSENPSTTGVRNADNLNLTASGSRSGYDNAMYWTVSAANQKVGMVDVLYTGIRFIIKNDKIYYCIGNWFPDIYVPGKFNINKETAKAILVNRVVSHYTIAGVKWDVKISKEALNKSVIKLKILPVKTSDKIEVRVVWQLYIPTPVDYLISVDVETGEIVEERPTVIS